MTQSFSFALALFAMLFIMIGFVLKINEIFWSAVGTYIAVTIWSVYVYIRR